MKRKPRPADSIIDAIVVKDKDFIRSMDERGFGGRALLGHWFDRIELAEAGQPIEVRGDELAHQLYGKVPTEELQHLTSVGNFTVFPDGTYEEVRA
jgi:hypothetical protein